MKGRDIFNVIDILGSGVSNFKSEGNPEIGGKDWKIRFFLKNTFFGSSFRFTEKLRGKYRYFPYTPHPHFPVSLIINQHLGLGW